LQRSARVSRPMGAVPLRRTAAAVGLRSPRPAAPLGGGGGGAVYRRTIGDNEQG